MVYGKLNKLLEKYPDRIPVVITRSKNKSDIDDIDRNKFLVPSDYTIGQLVAVIRKRIKIKPHQAIFVFIDNKLPAVSSTVAEVYSKYKDPNDGMLYVTYSGENTFG